MKPEVKNATLAKFDNIYTTQEERNNADKEYLEYISLSLIDDFPNHPFKLRDDDEMQQLYESINIYGVLSPVLLRPISNGRFEMISGHRRKFVCTKMNIKEVPSLVRNYTDDEAIILLVDSNLQREHILPSEKAWAYRLKNDALKHQGQKDVLTSRPAGEKWSITQLANQHKDSERTIQRYIRLTFLIPELLELVDNNKISLRPAVEISFLRDNEQKDLLETIISEDATPSIEQAKTMHQLSNNGALNIDKIFELLTQKKPNQNEKIVIQYERVNKFFHRGATPKEIENTIVLLLEQWAKQKLRKKEHER